MSIQRYTPSISLGINKRAVMKADERGVYITHASHQAEMQRVQGELDALKQAQKIIIFERVSSAVEKGLDEVIREVVKQSAMTTYKVDPELWRTAPARLAELMVDEKCKSAGLILADECMKDPVISMHHASIDDKPSLDPGVGLNSRCIMLDVEKAARHVANNVKTLGLKCIKSEVDWFTAGKMYDFESRYDVIYVCQDNHVSDLDEHDQWITKDMGAYLAVTYPGGSAAALFKKP